MAAVDFDDYVSGLDAGQRATLEEVRRRILSVVPDAEECISYAMPAFRLEGKTVAGLAAFKHHLSYLPHSGSVLPELADELSGYTMTSGSLHFLAGEPLPLPLVRRLLEVRMRQAGL